jgi:hypothetical protein
VDIDEDVRKSANARRWLAWATAGLLMAGVLSVGTVDSDPRTDGRIVAAGSAADGIGLPVTAPVIPPDPPVTIPVPSTALTTRSTTPAVTVRAPVTTTAPPITQPRRTSTTVTTPAPTTPVAAGNRATVTVANEAADAFKITVNGRVFQLAPGTSSGPVAIDLYAHGNDIIEVTAVADPMCGIGDADNYFDAGGRYRLTVASGPGMCQTMPGPRFTVTPA